MGQDNGCVDHHIQPLDFLSTTTHTHSNSACSECIMSAQRIAGLDGLRGLACIGVVIFHATPLAHCSTLGPFGVEIFMPLSGLMCGSILLAGEPISAFYLKRALRVLPLYLICSLTIIALGASRNATISLLTLTPDIGASHGEADCGILWSIVVELAAYVILPWIMRGRAIWFLIILAPMLRLLFTTIAPNHAAYYLSICRWDGILWGVVLARAGLSHPVVSRIARWSPMLMGLRLALAFLPADPFGPVYALILVPLGTVTAIGFIAWLSDHRLSMLESQPMQWLGRHSFGIYAIHALVVFRITEGPLRLPLTLAFTLPLAWASLRYFEQPIQRLRLRKRAAAHVVHVVDQAA